MKEIKARKSTLNYHIAPYASSLLNHLVNGYYAVVRQDPALIVHRLCGIAANSYYAYTYLRYCPPGRLADSKRWLTWVFALVAAVLLELHVILPVLGMSQYFFSNIAFFGAATGIGLAASPLATLVSCLFLLSLFCCALGFRDSLCLALLFFHFTSTPFFSLPSLSFAERGHSQP